MNFGLFLTSKIYKKMILNVKLCITYTDVGDLIVNKGIPIEYYKIYI